MALNPQKLIDAKTAEDFKIAVQLEKEIDAYLQKHYVGQKSFEIGVSVWIHKTVEDILRQLYIDAGWKKFTVKQYTQYNETSSYVVLEM